MRITPNDVHEQTFGTSFRGFDKVEVDSFLNHVADEMERLYDKVSGLETDLELERSTKSQLEELLGVARQLQDSILDKAKEDARVTMNQAELVAERITGEAREEAQQIRQDIQQMKDRKATLLAELSGLAHSVKEWVARMDEKSSAADEGTDIPGTVTARKSKPLIRLALDDALPTDETEAETFDLDDETPRQELAEREQEDDEAEEEQR